MDHAAIYLEAAELHKMPISGENYYSAYASDLMLGDISRLVKEDVVKTRVLAAVSEILEAFDGRKKAGDIRAVNREYRTYRIHRQANGQKIHSYRGYINTLIREALIHHARAHREELVK